MVRDKRVILIASFILTLSLYGISEAGGGVRVADLNGGRVYAVGKSPRSITSVDLDNDGDRDIAVANYGSNSLSILMNKGDGDLQPPVDYTVGRGPTWVVAGDFNRDGYNDLAVTNYLDNSVLILRNQGDGTFCPFCSILFYYPLVNGIGPGYMVSSDLNGDKYPDLAISNGGSDNVSILINKGDGIGQFNRPDLSYPVGRDPYNLTAADLNGDGRPDLAVSNYGSDSISILMNQGGGGFAPQVTYPVGRGPTAVTAADFDRDGDKDLAVQNYLEDTVLILSNNGTGQLTPVERYGEDVGPCFIVSSDLNGDGYPDLASIAEPDRIGVLINRGDGRFRPVVYYVTGSNPLSITLADLDNDGDNDIAVAGSGVNHVTILKNRGDGRFPSPVQYTAGPYPMSIASLDVDGDGDADLAVSNYHDSSLSILLNKGYGRFARLADYGVGKNPMNLHAADLNGDGRPDLAVSNYGSDSLSVLMNQGGGGFSPQVTYPVGRGPDGVTAGDFDLDGDSDLAVRGLSEVLILRNNGSGQLTPVERYGEDVGPCFIVSSDLNGDGYPDLASVDTPAETLSVWINKGDGGFHPAVSYPVGRGPAGLTAGDFDRDGDKDLAVTNYLDSDVMILRNTGTGELTPGERYGVNAGPYAISSPDMNGDGYPDLVVGGPGGEVAPVGAVRVEGPASDSISILINRGDGSGGFGPRMDYAAGRVPVSVIAGDFDHDGDPDIAVANHHDGNRISLISNLLDNTNTGSGVRVTVYRAAITFTSVTSPGVTTVTTTTTGEAPPEGYSLGAEPLYYDIHTTAGFSGPIEVSLGYEEGNYRNEGGLRLFHYAGGRWEDITRGLDTASNRIWGEVAGLSDFIIAGGIQYRVSGGAYNYPESSIYKASFSMDLSGPFSPSGWLKYYYSRTRMSLVGTGITALSVSGNSATISGSGKVNSVGGYTFTATLSDTPDGFGITIWRPDGGLHYSAGSRPVSGGDLTISQQ